MTWILCALVIAVVVAIVACRPSRTGAARTGQEALGRREQQPSGSALTVRLFADDVLVESLPLSLSIETFGGVSTVLLPRGTALPTVRRETFSTATDNQTSIKVHVLVGDRTLAADNLTVGTFSIVEIPAASRGVPKFEVTVAVDDQGSFRFSAKDLETGKAQPVSTAGSLSSPLSQMKVGSMLDAAKAEETKGEYGIPKTTPDDLDSLAVYTKKLRDLVESTRSSLKRGHGVPETARNACEEPLRKADQLLEKNMLSERASAKLNTLKVDEIESVINALGEAAKRCQ